MSGAAVLITGGAGFIGSNLADRFAGMGHRVTVYDALARPGVDRNLAWLRERHGERVVPAVATSDVVFHLAAQVAVTTSLGDPAGDFAINLAATMALLEAVRATGRRIPVIFASTNKVYGDLADVGFERGEDGYRPVDAALHARGVAEDRPLDFHTPYGCSKGAADQYVLDYARSYGLPTAVFRMSCIYGQRQMGTEDQGWVAHFLIRALEGRPVTLYGDGWQVRDILDVADAVDAYVAAWQRIECIAGTAFNLGGGPANAISLRTLLGTVGGLTGGAVDIRHDRWRDGDQRWFVADTARARRALGLGTPRDWRDGVEALARWLAAERGLSLAGPPLPVAVTG